MLVLQVCAGGPDFPDRACAAVWTAMDASRVFALWGGLGICYGDLLLSSSFSIQQVRPDIRVYVASKSPNEFPPALNTLARRSLQARV